MSAYANPLFGTEARPKLTTERKPKGKKSKDGSYGKEYLIERAKSFADKQPRLSGTRAFEKKSLSNLKPKLPVVQNKKKKPSEGKYHKESIKRQQSAEKWKFFDEQEKKDPNFPRPPRGTPEDHGWSQPGVARKLVVNKPVTTNNPMFGKNLPKRKTGTMAKEKVPMLSAEKLRKSRSIFKRLKSKKAGKRRRKKKKRTRKRRRTKKKRKRRRKKRRRTRK